MKKRSAAVDDRPEIRVVRKGPALSIRKVTPRVRQILDGVLTYSYIKQLRGQEAARRGKPIEVIPVQCYQLVKDPDRVVPLQVLTAPGFFPRIRQALETAGYRVQYTDNTRYPDPDVYQPLWDRLGDLELRWKQRYCIEQLVANPYGRLCCPTAYGKTFLIAALCRIWPHARIDVATHSNDVINMIYDDLCTFLPSVGLCTGQKKRLNERVMCYSGKSLHHSDGQAHVLLVDEVSEWATDDYLERVVRYPHARKYGFSANRPGDRMDNADFELEGAFGPIVVDITYQDAVAHDCIVDVRVRWVDIITDVNPCEDMGDLVRRERWGIWRNNQRNEKIAQVAREYPQQQVLITVATLEHAMFLKKLLPEFSLCYSEQGLTEDERAKYIRWGCINNDHPQMTVERRYKMRRAFEKGNLRKVIATPVWNRGVNFKKLSVLIRADGKNSAISDVQIPGRLARLSPNKPYGLLVDFGDQFDSGFKRRAGQRKQRYKKMGWQQETESRTGTENHLDHAHF